MVDFNIRWKRKLKAVPEENPAQKPAEPIQTQPSPIAPASTEEAQVIPSPHPPDEKNGNTNEDKPKWTDKAIAFFTVCLVAVAIWQGIIFRGQWQEMHSGGADTHDLALAANTQAKAAKAQADEAKEQDNKMVESLAKTDTLIKEATAQSTATNRLAAQAQRSANYAQEAIKTSVESERPWVGVSFYSLDPFDEGKTAKNYDQLHQ